MDWKEFYGDFMKTENMGKVRKFIKEERIRKVVLPSSDNVFRAFKLCPYDKLKVVIIGQEPYPAARHANGLAFSSFSNKRPGTLNNIFKEIHTSLYPEEDFNTCFKSNDLESWANQGVLLLNRILTVVDKESGSHAQIGWQEFTQSVIKKLSDTYHKRLIFVLWGQEAQTMITYINEAKHFVIKGEHPSPISADKGFFGCNHFLMIQDYLRRMYFEDIMTMVNKLDLDELIELFVLSFKKKNVVIKTEDMDKTLRFVLSNLNELFVYNDPNIKKLYELNFKT